MNISVNSLSGKKQPYVVDPENTVQEVKQLIEEKEGIEFDRIKLIFGGKQLEDEKTLESYKIKEGYAIIMAMKMGKSKPTKAPKKDESTTLAASDPPSDPKDDERKAFRARIENKMMQNQEATSAFGSNPEPDDASLISGNTSAMSNATFQSQIESRIKQRQEQANLAKNPAFPDPLPQDAAMIRNLDDGIVKGEKHFGVASDENKLFDVAEGTPITNDTSEDFYDDEANSVQAKRRVTRIVVVVGVILSVVVAVLASFFFRATVAEPTNPPTVPPTIFIDTSIPVNFELMDKIIFNNISKEEDFDLIDSPQMTSLLWLWDQSANKSNIIQQYVIGTFFAGINANELLTDNNETSECTWTYVVCSENMTITGIDLQNLKLEGVILTEIGFLTDLTELHLQDNLISGTIPSVLGEMVSLTVFDITSNNMVGTIPESFGKLTDLTVFNIGSNEIEGQLPPEMYGFRKLKHLEIWGNLGLNGSFPDTINKMESLEYLDATYISYRGNIPTTFGELSNLQFLHIGDNDVGGAIPTEIGKLEELHTLYFGFTGLSGTIPTEIGNLKNLGTLLIRSNMLTGSIPSELANLQKLNEFTIEMETISGKIPTELANWTSLEKITFCNTELKGSIPSEWCENGFKIFTKLRCEENCCRKCT